MPSRRLRRRPNPERLRTPATGSADLGFVAQWSVAGSAELGPFGGGVMFYWILRSPPGYPPDQAFMVSAYGTPEPLSHIRQLGFAASIDHARALIPAPRVRLDRQAFDQFVELWATDTGGRQDIPNDAEPGAAVAPGHGPRSR
jgi:hypothetical protein